jgi:pyrimidine operon attenuation protein/uracil phosphoribosyltransferase
LTAKGERKIVSEEEISKTISRLSHEIIEKNPDLSKLVLVGVFTRGVPLAKRIALKIKELEGIDIPLGELDVTFYRDDLDKKSPSLNAEKTHLPADVDGKTIILVDDVLFTGRSTRAAVDHLIDFGRPAKVQLAVLLDRGHRELPIRPDYVGKNIPTSREERVQVKLREIDGVDSVLLVDGEDD